MNPIIIRTLEKGDIPAVEDIFKLYWTDLEFLKKLSEKLINFVDQAAEFIEKKYRFYIAEENGEVVGVVGMRTIPSHMREFATTNNAAELYIIASKYKNKGIGKLLKSTIIEESKNLGFTEIILYSPDSHNDSWKFYENNNFKRLGPALAPDGEPGVIWRMELN